MAATDAGLDHIADQTHKVATNLADAEQRAEGLGNMFKQAALTFVGIDMVRKVIVEIVERTAIWQSLSQAVSKENLSRAGLLRREIDLTNEKHLLTASVATAAGIEGEFQKARLQALGDELEILQKQKLVAVEMQRIGHVSLGLLLVYKGLAIDLYLKTREFNQNLIEANASAMHRWVLLRETLITQAQLGISFAGITKSAAALVHYGMDTEKTFTENLRLVSQMEQGLGVSVNASAQLASIVERQIKGSFTEVAHVVAQIVDDTALAGDEAVRLATNIATAMGRLRPGISAQGLPEVVKLVGRYEAALKEVGGAPGAFQQLITSLTTPGGIVGAGALGVSPEFLATSQGVQNVMDRFSKFGDMLVGQSQGWERQFRLQMLADVFGTSADSANQMLIAIQRANQQQMGNISLQDRWRDQLHATNAGIARLGNSLLALTQGGLYPVVKAFGWVTNRLADLLEVLMRSRTVVYTVSVALGLGFFVLIGRMWSLVRALWAVVASATAAATAQARLAATQTATAAAGAAGGLGKFGFLAGILPTKDWLTAIGTQLSWMRLHGGGGIAGLTRGISAALMNVTTAGSGILRLPLFLISRGLGILTSSLGLWLLPLTFAAAMLSKIYNVNKQSREDQVAAQKIIISKQDALEAHQRMRIYAAARAGRPEEEVMKIYKSLAADALTKFGDIADPTARRAAQQAWLEEQRKQVELDVLKATATAGMYTPLSERTPEQAKREDAMLNINEKLLKVNEDQKTYMDKAAKRDEENTRDSEIEAAKNRSFFRDFGRGAKVLFGH
jgi:hypothetical protein